MTRTISRSYAAPPLEAGTPDRPSIAGGTAEFQELLSQAMDRALGIEEASLHAVVDLNSAALDVYRNSFWAAPVFSDLVDRTAKVFTFYIDLQMAWINVMLPYPKLESASPSVAPATTVESSPKHQAAPSTEAGPVTEEEEVIARDMEIAVGMRKAA